jgi:exopolysaccharide biosynthesis predicted pyruvyltransferase EpsI
MFWKEALGQLPNPTNDLDVSDEFMIGVGPDMAPVAAWGFLRTIELARSITTDRLHLGIAAALPGAPCTLRDNSHGKNAAVYGHSPLAGFPTSGSYANDPTETDAIIHAPIHGEPATRLAYMRLPSPTRAA